MTSRELPVEEWPRLDGTDLGPVWKGINPEHGKVLVVENEAGEIVGCWALLRCVHADGVWIRPDQRRKGTVAASLLSGLGRMARDWDVTAVWTSLLDPSVEVLAERLGAVSVPGKHVILPIGER